jgi:microcin C transport system ATP-binding protein
VVRQLSHRIGVLRGGRLIELGDAEQIFQEPREDYTASLVEASLSLRRRAADQTVHQDQTALPNRKEVIA